MPKVVLFANTDWYLYNFRLGLAKELAQTGWSVVLVSPNGPYVTELIKEGFNWQEAKLSRKGIGLLSELLSLIQIVRLYANQRPDIVHHFTLKCIAYGGIAARISGARSVHAFTGLGHVFTTESWRNRIIRPIVKWLLRLVIASNHVVFQNPDDQAEFSRQGLLEGASVHLIRGSGVNCKRFYPANRPVSNPKIRFILVARLLKEKGIHQFVEAAQLTRQQVSNTEFVVVGDPDPGNPSSIGQDEIEQWKKSGIVEFLGHQPDILSQLQASSIAVLPSFREGTPKSLLEAAACGLPLIATDVPGCREVVVHEVNGLLVPLGNVAALAAAMVRLTDNPLERASMGQASRSLAIENFSEDLVVTKTIGVYREILSQS